MVKMSLKPCPFCGGRAVIKFINGMGRVICTKCGVRSMYTTNIVKKHQARGELKALWNKRTVSHMDKQYRAGYHDGYLRNVSKEVYSHCKMLSKEAKEEIISAIDEMISKHRGDDDEV